nr:hypothetical protein [Tanacetum cinerariifolium]
LKPPAGLAAAADELSPTSYLGPRVIYNLFRGGKVTSGLSSLRLAEGSCDGAVENESVVVVKTKGLMVMQVGKI